MDLKKAAAVINEIADELRRDNDAAEIRRLKEIAGQKKAGTTDRHIANINVCDEIFQQLRNKGN